MAGSASVDTMLADAIAKMDAMNKRMDALETGGGSKNPIKGDDDDDDKKDDAFPPKKKDDSSKKADTKKADAKKADDDDDKKDDGVSGVKNKICDDDDDDKRDDAATVKFGDDGELEIKHEPTGGEKKPDKRRRGDSAKKADAKKADDDDDDKRDDDDDDDKKDDAFPPKKKDDSSKKSDDDDDKKDDAAKADSVALRRQIADQAATLRRLEALLKPKSDDEHAAFADAQARADAVFNGFGQRAPRPLEGETIIDYRKRLATKLKGYSPAWKAVKFSQLPEEAFSIAETQVYADAISAATNPTDLEAGELRQVTKTDPTTGVRTIVFYGKESFVKQMGRPGRRVKSFRTMASQ
jgi:hypothetical protein